MSELITPTQKTLLTMVADSLNETGKPLPLEDPFDIWREAHLQGVFLLAFHRVDPNSFPLYVQEELHGVAKRMLSSNMRLFIAHAALSELLEAAKIPHAIIKGYACSIWYPVPELRQLGDVDFIVAKEDLARTGRLLEANGYVPKTQSHKLHEVYIKDGIRFEMHFDLHGIPEGEAEGACRRALKGLIPNALLRQTPFGEMRLPSLFEHGLVLLLHIAHHLTNSGVGLRQLCDWAVFVDTVPDADFQKMYGTVLREVGLWRFACCLTEVCVLAFGIQKKEWLTESDPDTANLLLADVFSGGNLGQKNVQRSHQAYLITSGSASRSKRGRLTRLMLDMIYQKWPASKKYKILIPFGWMFYGGRYLLRAAEGKRPRLHVKSVLHGAEDRIELYDRLQLYQRSGNKESSLPERMI